MKENVIIITGSLTIIAALVMATDYGMQQSDQNDCLKLQVQAVALYSAPFFISKDQKAMCDYWNIKINAPVK